jgi:hypothetical protein
MPEGTDELLPLLLGPLGTLVFSLVVNVVLFRLFREEQRESRSMTQAVRDLTTEVRSWRIKVSK